MEFLTKLFSCICGQAADRSCLFGGQMFPLCERCMGIYVGAAIAILFWRCRRARGSLLISTILVLQIAPSGLHWCFEAPLLRTLSGAWFGFGLIGLLLPPCTSHCGKRKSSDVIAVLGPLLLAVLLSCEAVSSSITVGRLLVLLASVGFFSTVGLIVIGGRRFLGTPELHPTCVEGSVASSSPPRVIT